MKKATSFSCSSSIPNYFFWAGILCVCKKGGVNVRETPDGK